MTQSNLFAQVLETTEPAQVGKQVGAQLQTAAQVKGVTFPAILLENRLAGM